MSMIVHFLVQTMWFAMLLQLLTFLMHEDMLPLNATRFIHCKLHTPGFSHEQL